MNLKLTGNQLEHGNIDFLESYRFPNGKGFPLSHKEFVRTYGYGLSLNLFLIYIPMDDYGDSWNVRTEEITETYISELNDGADPWFDLEPDGSLALVKRWIPFASSENGHYLFWDTEHGTPNEFDIYITDFKGIGIRKAGNSIWDVFERLTNITSFKTLLPFSKEPLAKTFNPLKKADE
jgi:hypothetical protein